MTKTMAMLAAAWAATAGAVTTPMPEGCTTPDGMCVDAKGRLVIAAPNLDRKAPGAIFRLDAPGAKPVKWFDVPPFPGSGYAQPMGVCFGPDGELYVCDCQKPGEGRLLRVTFANDRVEKVETVAEGLANANGVKYLNGKLYLTQAYLPGVKRADGAATSGLYMFDARDRNVRVKNEPTDPQCVFSDRTENPKRRGGLNGVAVDAKGAIYTGNFGDGRVWKLTPGADGRIVRSELFVKPEAGIVTPDGLCADAEGNVYVADMFGDQSVRISPNGDVRAVKRGGYAKPSEPCVWNGALCVANFGSTTLDVQPLAGDVESAHAKIVARVTEGADRAAAAQAKLRDRVKLTDYRPETVNGTNTWGAALQRALDEHEIVVIPAGARYWIEKPVVMPSNRRIEAKGAEVALLPGVCTLLLRNAHAEDGTLSPIPRKVRGANVAVVGGRWIDWVPGRRGYGRTGRFNEGERRLGNFYGVSTLFYFGNVDGVTVRNATFVHTGGFAVQAGDATDLVFENIVFERCYADGLHLNGNLEGVLARNVRGSVGDDLVALNAYDWLNSSVNFGPQRFVLCEDLELAGESGYPAIRILPAVFRYRDGREVDCAISDVIFRRVKGITTFKMYLQTPPYRIGEAPEWGKVGSGGNLFFEDSAIDLKGPIDALPEYVKGDPVRGHFGVFEFGANLTSVYLRNLEVTFHADRYPTSHLMTVGPKSSVPGKKREREVFDPYLSCRVGRVVLDGVRVRGVAPAELVHATSFKDVNGDGRSTGAGTIGEIVRR